MGAKLTGKYGPVFSPSWLDQKVKKGRGFELAWLANWLHFFLTFDCRKWAQEGEAGVVACSTVYSLLKVEKEVGKRQGKQGCHMA